MGVDFCIVHRHKTPTSTSTSNVVVTFVILEEKVKKSAQASSSLQGPLQVTSQLSGATQEEPSSEVYLEESGGEDGKSDSSSRRNEGEIREQSSDGKGNNRNLQTSTALQLPRMSCRALHEQDELGHRNNKSGKEQAPH